MTKATKQKLKSGRLYPSKFRELYGMSLQEMADKYGGTPAVYSYHHSRGQLKEELEALEKQLQKQQKGI